MKIEVIETSLGNMFVWTGRDGASHATNRLIAPASSGEQVEVFSSAGTMTSSGYVRWDGPSSPGQPWFYGITKGGAPSLLAEDFNLGDKLCVKPPPNKTPHHLFERNLWLELSNEISLKYDPFSLYVESPIKT